MRKHPTYVTLYMFNSISSEGKKQEMKFVSYELFLVIHID